MIEWNDAVTGSNRVIRGGSWNFNATFLPSSHRNGVDPTVEDGYVGFRVASPPAAPIPEPGTWAAMAIFAGGAAYAGWRRRRRDGAHIGRVER